eukprot:5974639-Pyramimonas_sp.AAC.1
MLLSLIAEKSVCIKRPTCRAGLPLRVGDVPESVQSQAGGRQAAQQLVQFNLRDPIYDHAMCWIVRVHIQRRVLAKFNVQ